LDLGFYIPKEWRGQDTKNKQSSSLLEMYDDSDHMATSKALVNHSERCLRLYRELLDEGVAREMARMVLPLNTLTEIQVQIDLNNLIKYFILRDDNHAQWEHQEIARAMKEITRECFPWCMEMYDYFMKLQKQKKEVWETHVADSC
jgi:thymidylate synthase (FAD)